MAAERFMGTYVAVPAHVAEQAVALLRGISRTGTNTGAERVADVLDGSVRYEPDNHHNAALCPYCKGSS